MKNLKHFFVLFLSGMALIALFQFCENEITEELQDNNFENPFEFVGEMHNEGLKFAFQQIGDNKLGVLTLQDVSNLSTSFMLSKKEFGFIIKDHEKFKELEDMVQEAIKGGNKNIDTLSIFQNGTKANKYYIKLEKIFNGIKLTDTVSTFKLINKLEKEIWNSNLHENEKKGLLIMASVGKHSFSFWKINIKNYMGFISLKSKEDITEILLALLKADMIGSFVGFIGGAIIGAIGGTLIMPGVGSVTAAFLEGMQAAVWGAIIGSIWELLSLFVFPYVNNLQNYQDQPFDFLAEFKLNTLSVIQFPLRSRRC